MSHDRKDLKTGIKGLDKDLKVLFDICESKKLVTIKNAIANKKISNDDFAKVVPESLVRLALALTGPQFNLFLDDVYKNSIPLVKQAKSLIEKHFGNLFENEAAKSLLKKHTEEPEDKGESLADKVISRVSHYRVWEGNPPELTPAVHIGFKNKKGKILFDSTLDWEDLSFVLEALAEVLAGLLDKGKSLAKDKQIDLSDAQKVGERIRKTLEEFEKIKKLAPTYKIKIEGESKKEKESTRDS